VPSQRQLKWSQLRVGLTVIFASLALAVLIFLMSGTTGLFAKKLSIVAYFENAGGLRVGAPVRLEGVDIGNVSKIRLVRRNEQPPATVTTPQDQVSPGEVLDKPVQVTMTVGNRYVFDLHRDSVALLSTSGVLGETFIDIDSTDSRGPVVRDQDVLKTRRMRTIEGVVSASQSTIENFNVLVRRLDRIVSAIERGEGSVGKFLTDPTLYNRLNSAINQVQALVNQVASGQGSIGKLIADDEMYNKLTDAIDRLNKIVAEVDSGQGTVGKFLKDPALYNNANQTIAKANKLMEDINSGKGAIGKFASDPEFARKLDNTITKLNAIADQLNSGHGTAALFLQDPKLYNNADQALLETRNLIKAIRENPKRYLTIHFRVF
jgi:phospholipid/cholesterol/gamma-HCH transport system substrate-binding protein